MITINNDIQEEFCFLYGPDDVLIGAAKNYLAFLDVRCQIQRNKLKGYYFVFKGNKIEVDSNGRIWNYPDDLFDKADHYLDKLVWLK